MNNTLAVESVETSYAKNISDKLESSQNEVGKCIEAVHPFDNLAVIILNGEGKHDDHRTENEEESNKQGNMGKRRKRYMAYGER